MSKLKLTNSFLLNVTERKDTFFRGVEETVSYLKNADHTSK